MWPRVQGPVLGKGVTAEEPFVRREDVGVCRGKCSKSSISSSETRVKAGATAAFNTVVVGCRESSTAVVFVLVVCLLGVGKRPLPVCACVSVWLCGWREGIEGLTAFVCVSVHVCGRVRWGDGWARGGFGISSIVRASPVQSLLLPTAPPASVHSLVLLCCPHEWSPAQPQCALGVWRESRGRVRVSVGTLQRMDKQGIRGPHGHRLKF